MWLKHPGFLATVRQNWTQPLEGYGMFLLGQKLKRLRKELGIWNKNVFGNIFSKTLAAEEAMHQIEICLEESDTEDARTQWDVQGILLVEENAIGVEACNFFRDLLAAPAGTDEAAMQVLFDNIPTLLPNPDNDYLVRELINDEVKQAIFSLMAKVQQGPMASLGLSLCIVGILLGTMFVKQRRNSFIPLVISPEKSAFVRGREISDNILIAQDLVNGIDRRARGHNIIFKLDMMKAFDRVSWDYLSRLLLRFGFNPRFVALVINNLHSSWFSVLINGKPHGFFLADHGLKQGDPLSTFLFILVSEALSRGLRTLFSLGKLQAYAQPRGTLPISHLAFADDVVIFTRGDRRKEAIDNQTNGLSAAITTIHVPRFSSLQGSDQKGVHPTLDKQDAAEASELKKQDAFGWGTANLDQTRSLCNFTFAVQEPPKTVLHQLKQLVARFFWGETEGREKCHWRNWNALCLPTEHNSLGFNKLEDVMLAFGCKLWWKLRSGDTLWTRYTLSKNMVEHEHVTLAPVCLSSSRIWKRLTRVRAFMEDHMQTLLYDGSASF
ncbi:uncharacterized protein [Coffea arabica]|uniref:Reverse transcriptase domain-containing protein n=1 Tax=Coffea arabica TaxID=13443 RepID=A0ABM4UYK5_COFAR